MNYKRGDITSLKGENGALILCVHCSLRGAAWRVTSMPRAPVTWGGRSRSCCGKTPFCGKMSLSELKTYRRRRIIPL